MTDDYQQWADAGCPEPSAAERVDGGECEYCGEPADFRVEVEEQVAFLTCESCSRSNRVHAEDVLDNPVTVEVSADE